MDTELPFCSNDCDCDECHHDQLCECFDCYEAAEQSFLELQEAIATGN